MAGAGYKLFSTGDVLTASDVNTYLQQQTVMVFADASARTTALSGVLAEGMMSYLQDTDTVYVYNGAAWVGVSQDQTPLTTKGDLFTYSTADARLAVGNNGETLVADSSASTGLRWQGNFAAGKNKVINGDFNIWQRGTSFTNVSSSFQYTADRFQAGANGATTTHTITRETFTPGTAPVAGYEGKFFYRSTLTNIGAATVVVAYHKIEDVQTFAGQTVTLSFWAKADSARNLNYTIEQNFGSGGSSTVSVSSTNSTLSTSWARYSVTVSVPSISGKTIGSNSYLLISFNQAVANGSVLDLWGVQLEAGNVATAFQTATGTLAGELAACRYYYRRWTAGTAFGTLSMFGTGISSTQAVCAVPIDSMRVYPTSVGYANVNAGDGTNSYAVTALTLNQGNPNAVWLLATVASGLTQYRPTSLVGGNNTAGYIELSAEL